MEANLEQQVRARAYELWLRDGMADGRDLDHWRAAESEVMIALAVPATAQAIAPKKKAKSAKSSKTKM
jgi:hypothetical protein